MGYKAAAQILKKADTLKAKVAAKHQDLLNDLQVWMDQQQLQTIYHQVLVLDLEYALDKKVEQDLWTLGFKSHISTLQEQSRDKKNPRRNDAQSLLSWSLEAASGFYLSLLQELCSTYDLDLPFRKCGAILGKLRSYTEISSCPPQSSSCLYICQYCLVHLGDIARYRNQRQQAETFYRHAILVSPYSGHPYNQLALLEASQGDKLSTVYQYVRSIAVKNPFPAASANLFKTLTSTIDKDDPLQEVQTKMPLSEFIGTFLKAHALLHTQTDLQQAVFCVKSINATVTALVATQSFSRNQLIMMTVINMYALYHLGEGELTRDEAITAKLGLALIAGSLSAFLLPVYTLKNDETILDYFALPAIRLLLMWIKSKPQLLFGEEFTSRLQIWPGYCKLLNILSQYANTELKNEENRSFPLYYDIELQGFIPLQDAFKQFNFKASLYDKNAEKHLQAFNLIEIAKWLTKFEVNGSKLIISKEANSKMIFEPGCIQPDPTDKLLEEMKSFAVTDIGDGSKLKEKKAGILKPQGSLEKSREERVKLCEESINTTPKPINTASMKRTSQNVALQSIYKKLEENKQVKFSADATEKAPQPKQNPPGPHLGPTCNFPPFRAQTVHQTHPAMMQNEGNEYFSYMPPPKIPMPPQNPFRAPTDNLHYQGNASGPITGFNLPSSCLGPNANVFAAPQQSPIGRFPREDRTPNWWPLDTPQTQQYSSGQNTMRPTCPLPPQPRPQSYMPSSGASQDFYMLNQPVLGGGMQPMAANSNPEYFTTSPWPNSRPLHLNSIGMTGQSMGHPTGGISIRQAMLNESNKTSSAACNQGQMPQSYSLFSTTTWAPSLPQLRSDNVENRQSLFANAVPQSLQQLLEQQNQLQKGDT